MHTILLGVGLGLSWALVWLLAPLRRHRSPRVRVAMGLASLSLVPISSLTVAVETFLMVDKECFAHSARWDQGLSLLASGAVLTYFGYALAAGLERRWKLLRMVWSLPPASTPRLAALLDRRGGGRAVTVRLLPLGRPAAFLVGWRRPTIVLSDWMLDHLDDGELEAVVAHELAHFWRGDTAIAALAGLWARFFPLPLLRRVHETVLGEIEFAADRIAALRTGKPLALASALARFWRYGSGPDLASAGIAQFGGSRDLELRITRLMAPAATAGGPDREIAWSAVAVLLVAAMALTLLGIVPYWAMMHDHSALCQLPLLLGAR